MVVIAVIPVVIAVAVAVAVAAAVAAADQAQPDRGGRHPKRRRWGRLPPDPPRAGGSEGKAPAWAGAMSQGKKGRGKG